MNWRERAARNERIVDAYERGAPTTELARQYGVENTTIRDILLDVGISLRSRSHRRFQIHPNDLGLAP